MRIPPNIDLEYTAKAIVGIASPAVGLIEAFQEQIEWHLRIASLLLLAYTVHSIPHCSRAFPRIARRIGASQKSVAFPYLSAFRPN